MRVITGSARGKRLTTLEGLDTRPTTDKVKESVFNIIQFDVPGRKVLDLFSGSGQMAIEALSRGADSAVMIDSSRRAIKIIEENVERTGFTKQAKILCMDYAGYLKACKTQFDIIFLDPPYAGELLNNSLKLISEFDILSSNGIIVCERPADGETIFPEGFIKKDYKYGKTVITILTR